MYYLLALAVPPVVLLANQRIFARRRGLVVLAVLSSLLMYGVAVSSAFAVSAWYGYQAEKYDRDGDGVITLEEQSPEQSEATERAVNDAGRNLTIIFGAAWAIVVSAVFFGLVGVFRHASGKPQPPQESFSEQPKEVGRAVTRTDA